MTIRSLFMTALAAGAIVGTGRAQDPPAKADAKVNVELRGPVHEAFAQPFSAKLAPNSAIKKEPPAPIAEEPPEQRPEGNNVQWIPGYWAWNGGTNDFLWVSGTWRNVPEDRRWVPGFWTETEGGYVYVNGHWAATGEQDYQFVPEPPATRETFNIGNPPDANSFYIPGTWFYTADGWQWRDGYWADAREGYVWTPANYYWTPRGYVFSNGYWDYAPMNRGLLFAPVSFGSQAYLNPGFSFRPIYALATRAILGSLFVNSGLGQYFFGNYYGNQYSNLGFSPWLNAGTRGFDPLYNYVRFAGNNNTALGGLTLASLQATHDARVAGRAALPPVTLADALKLNTAAGADAAARSNVFVSPLTDLQKATGIRLQAVPEQQRTVIQQNVQQMIRRNAEIRSQFRSSLKPDGTGPGIRIPGVQTPGGNVPGINIPGINLPGVKGDGKGGIKIPGVNAGGQGQGTIPGTNIPPVRLPGGTVPPVKAGPGAGSPPVKVPGGNLPPVKLPGGGGPKPKGK